MSGNNNDKNNNREIDENHKNMTINTNNNNMTHDTRLLFIKYGYFQD